MMERISIGDTIITYDVVRTDRRTLGISIDSDKGIIVRSPETLPADRIEELVRSKAAWILQKLERVGEIKPAPAPREFLSGEKLPYLGRRYRLKVLEAPALGGRDVKVKFYQGRFIVKVAPEIYSEDERRVAAVRRELIDWYRARAVVKLNERVDRYKTRVGVAPGRVKVKRQKKRWGSCSGKGNINFNWKLVMAPMSIVDYIVVHELAHLRYPNHSADFWGLVETLIPGYEDCKEWLRVNRNRLVIS